MPPAHPRDHSRRWYSLSLALWAVTIVSLGPVVLASADRPAYASAAGGRWDAHPISVSETGRLRILVLWDAEADLVVTVRDPSGQRVTVARSNAYVLLVSTPADQIGLWTITIRAATGATDYELRVVVPGDGRERTERRWILTGSSMSKLWEAHPRLGAFFFDTPSSTALGNEDGDQIQVIEGFSTTAALKYESFERFDADVRLGRIVDGIRTILYDPENWDRTPPNERQDPAPYMSMFASLARTHGYLSTTTPSRDLMQVSGARCGVMNGESLSDAYLRCDIPGAASVLAEVFQVQSQVLEHEPAKYRSFVAQAVEQARAANPTVVPLAGLATSPWSYVASPQTMFRAWVSVHDLVAGHYVTVNTPELKVAARFFRMVWTYEVAGSPLALGHVSAVNSS